VFHFGFLQCSNPFLNRCWFMKLLTFVAMVLGRLALRGLAPPLYRLIFG
jgi:hypothetical protein